MSSDEWKKLSLILVAEEKRNERLEKLVQHCEQRIELHKTQDAGNIQGLERLVRRKNIFLDEQEKIARARFCRERFMYY